MSLKVVGLLSYEIVGKFTEHLLASLRIALLKPHPIPTLLVSFAKSNNAYILPEDVYSRFKYVYIPNQPIQKNKDFQLKLRCDDDYKMVFTDDIACSYRLPKSVNLFTLRKSEYVKIDGVVDLHPGYIISKMGFKLNTTGTAIIHIRILPIFRIKKLFEIAFDKLAAGIESFSDRRSNNVIDLGNGMKEYQYLDGLDDAASIYLTVQILADYPSHIFSCGLIYRGDKPARISSDLTHKQIDVSIANALVVLKRDRVRFMKIIK